MFNGLKNLFVPKKEESIESLSKPISEWAKDETKTVEVDNVAKVSNVVATTVSEPIVKEIQEPKALLSPPPIVSFKNVTKCFNGVVAVENVTFDVIDIPNKGELISIVGPSGCGKSTILRIIAGLEPQFPHTSGDAFVFGDKITGPCITRGVVDQKYSLLPNLSVLDNIGFGLKLQGVGRKERKDKSMEWVKKVGLEGSENKYPHELSGGMQQRVSLASTLILEPKILLMDEPFGALDPKTRLKMQELLVQLWKEIEATIFIVTHSMEEAVYLGDRIFRMESNPGRLVEILSAPRPDMSPEEMRKQPWFSEMVEELLQRVEKSCGKQGELKCVQSALTSFNRRHKDAEIDKDELSLLKLIT